MDHFLYLPRDERCSYYEETAERMRVSPEIIEKDFWVCWTLKTLFQLPDMGEHLIFKGGTSLSKVYRVIQRFSEDIDVSIDRHFLGFVGGDEPEAAASNKERQRRVDALMEACQKKIREELHPALTAAVGQRIGGEKNWAMEFDESDPDGQTLLFHYPTSLPPQSSGYIRRSVKIEMGARADHWPCESKPITPYVAEQFPGGFKEPDGLVKVLSAERTFWEKATILHAEYHRPAEKESPSRLSRHYYDFDALIRSGIDKNADLALLARVAAHKTVFFRSAWARSSEASPGTLRIIRHMFTADPSAHVWADGRLYLYPSTDVAPPRGCDLMDGYHVFSTDNMRDWVDHGEILHSKDVKWGRPEGGFMWAPDCAYRNGVYYYYFPHPSDTKWNDSWKIGVATSTKPASDFVVQGFIPGLESLIDPCVFTDDDGTVYFYHGGGGKCRGGKLADSMVEIEGSMQEMKGLEDFHEGTWVFKRNGIYYLIYSDNFRPNNRMQYATSDNPLGPWTSKGVFIEPTDSDTMHGSVVQFKGQWYIFYHSAALSSGIGTLRSVCFDLLNFNDDGTLQKVTKTLEPDWQSFLLSPDSLLKNHSFEHATGPFIQAWRTGSPNYSSTSSQAAEGTRALKYEGTGCNPIQQTVKIQPNKKYEVSVWMKMDPESIGSVIFDTSDRFDKTCQFGIGPKQAGQWIRKTGTFSSGENDSVTLRCYTSGEFSGTCYWDAVCLKEIQP